MHNPQAQVTYDPNNEWEDRWYDLRPLRTEGQVEEYAALIAAIPLGVGVEFGMGYGWVLGVEGSWRSTFTDYLDDISGMYANPDYLSPLAEAISSQPMKRPLQPLMTRPLETCTTTNTMKAERPVETQIPTTATVRFR